MRVSADLTGPEWGALDRWAENHGMTRPQAVRAAIVRMTDEYETEIVELGKMLIIHPDMIVDNNGTEA